MKIGQFQDQGKRELILHFWWITMILPTLQQVFFLLKWFFVMDIGVMYHTNHYLIRNKILLKLETRTKELIERMFTYNSCRLTKDFLTDWWLHSCLKIKTVFQIQPTLFTREILHYWNFGLWEHFINRKYNPWSLFTKTPSWYEIGSLPSLLEQTVKNDSVRYDLSGPSRRFSMRMWQNTCINTVRCVMVCDVYFSY